VKKVYYKPIDSYQKTEEINKAVVELLERLIQTEQWALESYIPLKVHCGEKGNQTYIEPKNYDGLIDYLTGKNIETAFMETNVLYNGQRKTKEQHLKIAAEHGFTRIPMIIADGESGEGYRNVIINQKHFKSCKLAEELARHSQVIVLSHFKGHMLAGFGGAVKQLGMGFASRGGKLDQHANSIPKINSWKCKACKACVLKCPEKAITITKKARIDREKCVGCASCVGVCPHQAISNSWLASLTRSFNERLAEYALAASKDKRHIYISFAFNITKGCDCEGHPMKIAGKDLGVLVSTDPVAIDQACLDLMDRNKGNYHIKRGRYTLEYGEKIGLGSRKYELVTL
jgi:uncharacterized Fe-S center protein